MINTINKADVKLDKEIEMTNNAMLKSNPCLFLEWNFEKNNKLGLDIYKVKRTTKTLCYWNCPKCKSMYYTSIGNRTRGNGCPYCAGRLANHTNSLASLNPELASEWHSTKNGSLTPNDVTCGSNKKVWWLGVCGHEWEAIISNRDSKGRKCPYCSNQKVLVGFNDMWTTNPELASLLADPEDGYRYMQGSNKKLDWKCISCESIIRKKSISKAKDRGLSCTVCSDNISYPEKVMFSFLTDLGLNFETQKTFEWAKDKRYDFYIPSLEIIIETHGIQHSEETFSRMNGRTLKEEQENDRLKERLAMENGIKKYIVIDCKFSDIEYIRNSISNSELNDILNLSDVNWTSINTASQKSHVLEVWKLFNSGLSIKDISNKINIKEITIVSYLKKGAKAGRCSYDYKPTVIRKVIQLDSNMNYIKEWNSISAVQKGLNLTHRKTVIRACQSKRNDAYGYKWMYKEDYEKYIEECKS